MQIRLGLHSHAVILLNKSLPQMWNRSLIIYNHDEDHYNTFQVRQKKLTNINNTLKELSIILIGSSVAGQRESSRAWTQETTVEDSD